ncbi:putative glucose dehydrogenase [Ixodes scapularis]
MIVPMGGGSAGSVLANRLSEDPSNRVLLLEAGGLEDGITDVPLFATLSQHTERDWSFQTEPQKNCCFALRDQRNVWSNGKVLGGSSVLNFMIYNRGNRRDYDSWAEGGALGWSYDEVLPYFMSVLFGHPTIVVRGVGPPAPFTSLVLFSAEAFQTSDVLFFGKGI